MHKNLTIGHNMATHSYKKALSYLFFTIFMLLTSIVVILIVSLCANSHTAHEQLRLGKGASFLIGAGLMGVSIISFHFSYRNYQIACQLERMGNSTDGIVTNKWEDDFDGRMMYYVSYRFREDVEAWENISSALYRKLKKGCKVPVRYLNQDPSIARLECEKIAAG